MKFEEALAAMREGKKVKLPLIYPSIKELRIVNEVLLIKNKRKYEIASSIPHGAILAEDWEIIDDTL